jgi:hypothetical protein
VLPDLGVEVEVFFGLDGGIGGVGDGFDAVEPFDGPGANIPEYYCAEREAVDLGERLTVHFPGEHDFVELYFGVGDGDNVVLDFALGLGQCGLMRELEEARPA